MGLAAKVLDGDVRAAARLISSIEDDSPDALEEIDAIYPHTGRAFVIGVTGPPGAGKSTLTDNLVGHFRRQQKKVGVIAIDPSSHRSGGALLGDRIRMQRHSADRQVFVRSLATRGWAGGLARAAIGAVYVMDAMGKDVILVETVGSGQVEVDIARAADTTLLVLMPGAGDEIQMMKAGILEAADVYAVNKADRGGAENLKASLEAMLRMKTDSVPWWHPGIVVTEAISDKGTGELAEEIMRHREALVSSGELPRRRNERAKLELVETIKGFLRDITNRIDVGSYLEKISEEVVRGRTNLRRAANEITGRLAVELEKLKGRVHEGLAVENRPDESPGGDS